jgi:photosystem II stability/assembly factor-like uncharacterized protein
MIEKSFKTGDNLPKSSRFYPLGWEKTGYSGVGVKNMHFADARTGWAVGQDGTILATRDAGAHWEPQNTGTDKRLSAVHFADAHTCLYS